MADEAEKSARSIAKDEATAVCKLLDKRKEMISGDEDVLTLAASARELSGLVTRLAAAIEKVEKNMTETAVLLVLDSLEATTTEGSSARKWFKSTVVPMAREASPSVMFEAMAAGLLTK